MNKLAGATNKIHTHTIRNLFELDWETAPQPQAEDDLALSSIVSSLTISFGYALAHTAISAAFFLAESKSNR